MDSMANSLTLEERSSEVGLTGHQGGKIAYAIAVETIEKSNGLCKRKCVLCKKSK
jgi:hypothetical protein